MLTGEDFDFHCHSNLTRAVLPYGLTESDVHDVLNVFQVTGLNKDDKYFMLAWLPFRPICSTLKCLLTETTGKPLLPGQEITLSFSRRLMYFVPYLLVQEGTCQCGDGVRERTV